MTLSADNLGEDLGEDLERLDAFLMSDQLPDEALMLSEVDGFLTGIALGPEAIMPSEWLPVVWGGLLPTAFFTGVSVAAREASRRLSE